MSRGPDVALAARRRAWWQHRHARHLDRVNKAALKKKAVFLGYVGVIPRLCRTWGRPVAFCLVLLLCAAASAQAQPPVAPSQPGNTKNQEVTGAVGATTVVTLTATATPSTRAHLASLDYRCSSGTAQVTITDGVGGATIWTSPPAFVGTTVGSKSWYPALASTLGKSLVITLSACGSTATGTLDVQGHVF